MLRAVDLAAAGDFVAGVLEQMVRGVRAIDGGGLGMKYRFYVLPLWGFGRHGDGRTVRGGIGFICLFGMGVVC